LPTGAIILVGLGATELSMPAASVGRIKALLRLVSAEQCHEVAARALDVVSAEEAEAIASELVRATQERTA
jgi:phosphoenolpyruvate-protein kinase (PTS system EI component)